MRLKNLRIFKLGQAKLFTLILILFNPIKVDSAPLHFDSLHETRTLHTSKPLSPTRRSYIVCRRDEVWFDPSRQRSSVWYPKIPDMTQWVREESFRYARKTNKTDPFRIRSQSRLTKGDPLNTNTDDQISQLKEPYVENDRSQSNVRAPSPMKDTQSDPGEKDVAMTPVTPSFSPYEPHGDRIEKRPSLSFSRDGSLSMPPPRSGFLFFPLDGVLSDHNLVQQDKGSFDSLEDSNGGVSPQKITLQIQIPSENRILSNGFDKSPPAELMASIATKKNDKDCDKKKYHNEKLPSNSLSDEVATEKFPQRQSSPQTFAKQLKGEVAQNFRPPSLEEDNSRAKLTSHTSRFSNNEKTDSKKPLLGDEDSVKQGKVTPEVIKDDTPLKQKRHLYQQSWSRSDSSSVDVDIEKFFSTKGIYIHSSNAAKSNLVSSSGDSSNYLIKTRRKDPDYLAPSDSSSQRPLMKTTQNLGYKAYYIEKDNGMIEKDNEVKAKIPTERSNEIYINPSTAKDKFPLKSTLYVQDDVISLRRSEERSAQTLTSARLTKNTVYNKVARKVSEYQNGDENIVRLRNPFPSDNSRSESMDQLTPMNDEQNDSNQYHLSYGKQSQTTESGISWSSGIWPSSWTLLRFSSWKRNVADVRERREYKKFVREEG